MAEQSKVVLTGASGYLGQHLIVLLAKKGYQVVALVRDSTKLPSGEWESVHYDLQSSAELPAEVFRNAAAVIHAAANMGDQSLPEQMEIKAAQSIVEQARLANVGQLVFVSSCVANPDGPSRYARVKWAIEQVFLNAGGTIIRPGLIYGGSTSGNRGLFALLDRWAKATPFVPAFLPPLWVQPIHVDDLCEIILNSIEETNDPLSIYEAAAEGIHLTAFLRRLAWHRHHRYPALFPLPISLISFAAAAGARAAPLISTYYVERLKGLRSLRRRPVGEAHPVASMTLRQLVDGLSDSPRRGLLEEGRALGRYLNGQYPGYLILSRYVRALEQTTPDSKHCLEFAPLYLRWPSALRLVDPKYPLCQLTPDFRDEIARRLEFMAALSESNSGTAPKYHARKPALLPIVALDLSLRIFADILLRGLGAIARLGSRLPKLARTQAN